MPTFLALGTNLGDRAANLQATIAALHPKVRVTAQSPIYETAPWGYTDQPDFLNQVIKAQTALPPPDLLAHLKRIEARLGRKPTFRYGPRLIDLDILFYDDLALETPELTLPHPRLHERAFVLVPLADIAPDLQHPIFGGKTIWEFTQEIGMEGIKRWQDALRVLPTSPPQFF